MNSFMIIDYFKDITLYIIYVKINLSLELHFAIISFSYA